MVKEIRICDRCGKEVVRTNFDETPEVSPVMVEIVLHKRYDKESKFIPPEMDLCQKCYVELNEHIKAFFKKRGGGK